MRKLYKTLGFIGLVGVTVAAMVLQACTASHARSTDSALQAAQRRAAANAPSSSEAGGNVPADGRNAFFTENGARPLDPNSFDAFQNGYANSTGNGDVFGKREGDYGVVPRIDLSQALGASQGGGGGQPSPFVPQLGDIPLLRHFAPPAFAIPAEPPPPPPRTEVTIRPGEELWVIERTHPPAYQYTRATDDIPGCGSLMTRREENGSWRELPVPLAHTSVNARVDGYISTVRVQQQFHNPFDSKIEALYVFPLPEDAAVNDFLMTVGSRTIRGVIREREQAEKIYENARRQGYVASLMTQERPNIFTQAVANIEPGREIDIDIQYFGTLPYRDGAFEFDFPMVVGPRFNPPWTTREGTGVGAVGYGAQGASGQQTEVQYLRPQQRTGTDISITVDINAGISIESLESPSHTINVQHDRATPHIARISLASTDTIPNKDFVLRYRVAGQSVKSAMITQPESGGRAGGFFSMLLVPPSDLSYIERGPVEVVFLIDRSGSMEGEPLAQAKAAVEHTLARLDVDDTFQIIDFSDSASTIGDEPLKATRRNLDKGLAYIRALQAGGGTMMLNGVKAALSMPRDRAGGRTRFVCFLTDGFIGNDPEVLGFVREHLGDSRIMTMGVGTSPNRYLLEGLARLGRGAAAFLNPGDHPEETMDLFLDRISHPALADLSIDWAGMDVSDVYPKRLPDLYAGRPVVITGRCKGTPTGPITIKGRAGRERLPSTATVRCDDRPDANTALGSLWARKKIEELSDKATNDGGPRLTEQIKQTALDYGLMSSYTAFIAVDSMTRTAGTFGTTVVQPVPVPQGVRYDTTVER